VKNRQNIDLGERTGYAEPRRIAEMKAKPKEICQGFATEHIPPNPALLLTAWDVATGRQMTRRESRLLAIVIKTVVEGCGSGLVGHPLSWPPGQPLSLTRKQGQFWKGYEGQCIGSN